MGRGIFFRTFKHTFGCRKLRSRSARTRSWSWTGHSSAYGGSVCSAVASCARSGQEPVRLSPAAALHACQRTLREYRVRPETPRRRCGPSCAAPAGLLPAALLENQSRLPTQKTPHAHRHPPPYAGHSTPNRPSPSPATPGGISVIGVGWHSVVNPWAVARRAHLQPLAWLAAVLIQARPVRAEYERRFPALAGEAPP